MVFYFSGTGHSQLAAQQIAGAAGDELVSINRHLKDGTPGVFSSERPLVFVAPTYAWRMPRVVEDWLRAASFEGSRDAYFILTCAGGCGNAGLYAKRLCAEKGLRFRGLAPVLMPENYAAMFPTPDADECKAIIARAKPVLAALADLICSGASLPDGSASLKNRLLSGPVNRLYYPLAIHDKKFTASASCVSCGKCAQRCPLNNITMAVDGRPVWNGDCTHCMACINGCPTGAIGYGAKSGGRHRPFLLKE